MGEIEHLPDLAADINDEHRNCERAVNAALVHLQATFSGRDRCSWCGQSKAEHTRSANS